MPLMSDALTRALLASPWLIGLLWLALHGADWTLTLKGARMRHELLQATGAQAQSDYELNPLFKADVAKLRFGSRRFLMTWIGIAVVLPVLFVLVARIGEDVLGAVTMWMV